MDLGDRVQPHLNILQQCRAECTCGKSRDYAQRAGQREQIARAGGRERNFRQKPLQVENRLQMLA
jgi:hypothetical protein